VGDCFSGAVLGPAGHRAGSPLPLTEGRRLVTPKDLIDLAGPTGETPSSAAVTTDSPTAADGDTVPCVYCGGPMQSASFVYSSATKRLVSAACPACGRGITVATVTWRRWTNPEARTRRIDLPS